MMDYLFAPERCYKILKPEWKKMIEHRDLFISKRARFSFSGYSFSQINRIKNHRNYLLNPPKKKPERSDYGLPEVSVFPETQYEQILVLSYEYVAPERQRAFFDQASSMINSEIDILFHEYMDHEIANIAIEQFRCGQDKFLNLLASVNKMFIKEEYIHMAQKELSYFAAKKEYERYEQWKKSRNPKRAEMEARCGYDAKHLSHAYRLMVQGTEILDGVGIRVDRTGIDREYIMDIKLGRVKYETVMEQVEAMEKELNNKYNTTKIPKTADNKKIEELTMEIIDEYVWRRK
jgi:predicted nucleotidyltransferase